MGDWGNSASQFLCSLFPALLSGSHGSSLIPPHVPTSPTYKMLQWVVVVLC